MFQILLVEAACTVGMLVFFAAAVAGVVSLAASYNRLIRDAENMSITKRKELKAIKTKFLNSYAQEETEEENFGVRERINVEVFVDKSVNRMKICGLKPHTRKVISNQLLMISVIFAGVGAFRGILAKRVLREILPFYLLAFLALYVYFSVVSICDFQSKDRLLRLTIIEYIENHMINRIRVARAFENQGEVLRMLEEEENPVFGREEEDELEALLQEFLI